MEATVYYSRAQFLTFPAGQPERVLQNGISTIVDPPYVAFSPYGTDKWGRFITKDPLIIKHIEERRQRQIAEGSAPDVLTAEEYTQATTPIEMKMASLEDENTRLRREIQERNDLINKLQREGKLPSK